MEHDYHTDEQIRQILSYKNVAVVGMSRDPAKAAHFVPKYLLENGFNIFPVNPHADKILGKKCYSDISHIDSELDIIDVFRPSDQVPSITDGVISQNPKVLWLQEGIHNSEAEETVKNKCKKIDIVFNRCMLAEHRRLY